MKRIKISIVASGFHILILFFGLFNQRISSENLPLQYEQEELRRYLHELRTQSNLQVNPCTDFRQYACGNISRQPLKLSLPGPINSDNYEIVIRKLLIDSHYKSESERKTSELYMSCRKVRDPKLIFKQIDSLKFIESSWPVIRKPTRKHISYILGEMSTMESNYLGLLTITVNQRERKLELNPLINAPTLNYEHVIRKMEQFSVNSLNFTFETDKIIELSKKLNDLESKYKRSGIASYKLIEKNIENYLDISEILPDFEWSEYFRALFTLTDIKPESFLEIPIKLKNYELLNKVLDLITTTDPKVVANYLIYNYIEYLTNFKCEYFLPYFRPAILRKIWERNLQNDQNQLKILKNIERFEENLKIVQKEMKYLNFNQIKHMIDVKKYIIHNQTSILDDEVYNRFYGSFNIDPEKFYLNIMKYSTSTLKYSLPELKNIFLQAPNDDGFKKAINGILDDSIDPFFSSKPFLYYFISENLYMWKKLFSSNDDVNWRNNSLALSCLDQQNENHVIEENYEYLNDYAAIRLGYLDYIKYLYKTGLRLVIDAEINAIGLGDSEKVYFLALMQNICHQDKPMLTERLIRILKHSELFIEAYQCPVSSEMNKLSDKKCKIKKCNSYLNDSLKVLPYKVEC